MDWFARRGIFRTDGDPVLKIPDVRQRADFDCGAAAIEAVCRYYGYKSRGADKLANPVQGMEPGTVEAVLRHFGFRIIVGQLLVEDLKHFSRLKMPVVCPIDHEGGHWVVAAGVSRGRVHFHCPLRGAVAVPVGEWEAGWKSSTTTGIEYENWGIAVG
jgi:ABC-type bacteriocin/lantibiotic exporter with double-glycine peptidase domain